MPSKLRSWHLVLVAAVLIAGILAAWAATSIAGARSRYSGDPVASMAPMAHAPHAQPGSAPAGSAPTPPAHANGRISLGRAADAAEAAARGRAIDAKVEHDRVGTRYVTTYEVKVERADGTRFDVIVDAAGRVVTASRDMED